MYLELTAYLRNPSQYEDNHFKVYSKLISVIVYSLAKVNNSFAIVSNDQDLVLENVAPPNTRYAWNGGRKLVENNTKNCQYRRIPVVL